MTHETQTKAPNPTGFVHDPECRLGTSFKRADGTQAYACECAIREVGWIAHEALAIHAEGIANDSPRGQAYLARKRALLAYIEATR